MNIFMGLLVIGLIIICVGVPICKLLSEQIDFDNKKQ